MSTMADTVEQTEGRDSVAQWRWDEALRMGYAPLMAQEIMRHTEVDLHDLRKLINGGCELTTAYNILRG